MDSASSNNRSVRIPSLDGLRAISILLVIVAHFLHGFGITDLNVGSLGVRVFFVISGFLITGLLIRELDKTSTIRLAKFYYRRTLRIFPPYYFFLGVMLILALAGGAADLFRSFARAFAYVCKYIDPLRWDLGHTWSLSVEEQFYLIYPGILLLLRPRKTTFLLGLLMLVSPFVRIADFQMFGEARWVGMGFHSNVDALAAGCLLAFIRPKLHANTSYLKILNSRLIILVPLIILVLHSQADHPNIFAILVSIVNVLIALGLDFAVTNYENNAFGKVLNSRPLVTLGVMSYSIYLWQQPFLDPYSGAWFTKFPFNILGIAVCSCFSYFAIERFSLRQRQKWESKIFGEKTPRPALDDSPSVVATRS
jgi:peptidoglycan/LPS O-acetylase OafA/YrhL